MMIDPTNDGVTTCDVVSDGGTNGSVIKGYET